MKEEEEEEEEERQAARKRARDGDGPAESAATKAGKTAEPDAREQIQWGETQRWPRARDSRVCS